MQDDESGATAIVGAVDDQPAPAGADARALRVLLAGSPLALFNLPGDLEPSFQHHLLTRAAAMLRSSVYGLIGVYLLVVVPIGLFSHDASVGAWMKYAVLPIGVVLAGIWLTTRVGRLAPYVQTTLTLSLFITLSGTLYCAMRLSGQYYGQVAAYESIFILFIAFSILHMPGVAMLRGALAAFVFALLASVWQGVDPRWLDIMLYFFVPLLLCAANGYMIEYTARREFVQTQYHQQQRVALLHDVAAVANEARTPDDVLDYALERVVEHNGWMGGRAYRVRNLQLEPVRFRVVEGIAGIGSATLPAGKTISSLARRTWLGGAPTWTQSTSEILFPGSYGPLALTAYAFPVRVELEVVAVLEFFSSEAEHPQERLLSTMEQIGVQLGLVFERERRERELMYKATHDLLTDLPNRNLLMERVQQLIADTASGQTPAYALLFLDIDRFKWVNDSFGHGGGDRLLVDVGKRLLHSVRAGDVVARLGGDEFAILLTNTPHVDDAVAVARHLLQKLQGPVRIDEYLIHVDASIGIAMGHADYTFPEEPLRDADAAMYQAKARGRAGYVVFASHMREQAASRLRLVAELRHAVDNHQLRLHYQPIVSLQTGCVSGFEALVRWEHPVRGMISPNDFVPLAEEAGLITALTRWVMREACRQLREWQETHDPILYLSVNMCARDFAHSDMPVKVRDLLTSSGVLRGTLRLEITESQIMENVDACLRNMRLLAEDDVAVYIDDFGTGYSSLHSLATFSASTLKIDRSFIAQAMGGGRDAIIVQTIAALGRHLGLSVIAEGVETDEQLAMLRSLGCDYGQGYFFSRPVDPERAQALIGHRYFTPCAEENPSPGAVEAPAEVEVAPTRQLSA